MNALDISWKRKITAHSNPSASLLKLASVCLLTAQNKRQAFCLHAPDRSIPTLKSQHARAVFHQRTICGGSQEQRCLLAPGEKGPLQTVKLIGLEVFANRDVNEVKEFQYLS